MNRLDTFKVITLLFSEVAVFILFIVTYGYVSLAKMQPYALWLFLGYYFFTYLRFLGEYFILQLTEEKQVEAETKAMILVLLHRFCGLLVLIAVIVLVIHATLTGL